MPLNSMYSNILKEYKEKNNLNNRQLGKLLEIPDASVIRILDGTSTRIRFDTLEKIAHLAGLDSNAIVEDILQIRKPIFRVSKERDNLFSDENIIGYQRVIEEDDEEGDFFLKVTDDSMSLARIYNHDLIYVKQCDDVSNGTIAVVMVGKDVMIRRVIKKPSLLILEAANSNVENKYFTAREIVEKPVRIMGEVVYSRTDFRN